MWMGVLRREVDKTLHVEGVLSGLFVRFLVAFLSIVECGVRVT